MGSILSTVANIFGGFGKWLQDPTQVVTTNTQTGQSTSQDVPSFIWQGFLSSPQNPGILGNTVLGFLGLAMVVVGLYAMVGGGDTVVDVAAPEAAAAEKAGEAADETISKAQSKGEKARKRKEAA